MGAFGSGLGNQTLVMSMASLDVFLLLLISELLCNRSSFYVQVLHRGPVLGIEGFGGGGGGGSQI